MYLLKKAEEELTRKINSSSILNEAVKEINIPIIKPVPARKSIPFFNNLAGSVSKQINKFSNWLISFVPETIRTTVNEKTDNLKNYIKKIFNKT